MIIVYSQFPTNSDSSEVRIRLESTTIREAFRRHCTRGRKSLCFLCTSSNLAVGFVSCCDTKHPNDRQAFHLFCNERSNTNQGWPSFKLTLKERTPGVVQTLRSHDEVVVACGRGGIVS